MFDSQMTLLKSYLEALVAELALDPHDADAWARAKEGIAAARAKEPELAAVVDAQDAAGLRALVEQWSSGKRHLPEQDREVLRRALTAYRKSLKLTRLDAESKIGGSPMSSGRASSITGITPPNRYPRAVWDELVRQKRLLGGKQGIYELPPE